MAEFRPQKIKTRTRIRHWLNYEKKRLIKAHDIARELNYDDFEIKRTISLGHSVWNVDFSERGLLKLRANKNNPDFKEVVKMIKLKIEDELIKIKEHNLEEIFLNAKIELLKDLENLINN